MVLSVARKKARGGTLFINASCLSPTYTFSLTYILQKNDSCSDHAFDSFWYCRNSCTIPVLCCVVAELSPYTRLAAIMGGAGISHGRGGAGKYLLLLQSVLKVIFLDRIYLSHTDNFLTRKHLLQRTHRFAQGLCHPDHQTGRLHHRSRRFREHGLQRSRTSRARAGKPGC